MFSFFKKFANKKRELSQCKVDSKNDKDNQSGLCRKDFESLIKNSNFDGDAEAPMEKDETQRKLDIFIKNVENPKYYDDDSDIAEYYYEAESDMDDEPEDSKISENKKLINNCSPNQLIRILMSIETDSFHESGGYNKFTVLNMIKRRKDFESLIKNSNFANHLARASMMARVIHREDDDDDDDDDGGEDHSYTRWFG